MLVELSALKVAIVNFDLRNTLYSNCTFGILP